VRPQRTFLADTEERECRVPLDLGAMLAPFEILYHTIWRVRTNVPAILARLRRLDFGFESVD
jgi:hypothetical protein